MKFAVSKPVLNDTLARLMGVVERRSTIPVLANISMETGKDTLRLIATDMDMEVSEWVEANVALSGSATVPAGTLSDIAKKLNTDRVNFTFRDERMQIVGGQAKFLLGTIPVADFPVFGHGDGQPCTVTMDSAELRNLIDAVKGAQSTEETRYYLNGAFFHPLNHEDGTGTVIRAVATDGNRLARADAVVMDIDGDMPDVIIPRKALAEMRRIVDKPQGEVRLIFRANTVTLECGQVTLKSKLIDGTFPDYTRVIPDAEAVHKFTVSTVPFRDAVERVGSIGGKSGAVKLSFGKEVVGFSFRSDDGATAEDEIPVSGDGKIDIGFNAAYLAEMTSHFPGDFDLALTDSASPALITTKDDPTYLYVIMPMRV